MSSFEFVFSLLVILLGLGLGHVLAGFASAVKKRPELRIGWGTGLLATWVMTETIIFWRIIWRARDVVPDTTPALFAGFGVTALYYFAGALVFPDDLSGRKSLDDYFMQEKTRVIGAILAAVALSLVLRSVVLGMTAWSILSWFAWGSLAIIYVAGPVAMLTRNLRVATACVAVLVAVDLLDPVGWMLWGE